MRTSGTRGWLSRHYVLPGRATRLAFVRSSLSRFASSVVTAWDRARLMLETVDAQRVGQRLLSGQLPNRAQMTVSGCVRVVADDIDELSGIAAVWTITRSYGWRRASHHTHYELRGSKWYPLGSDSMSPEERFPGPRPSAQEAGPACLLVRCAAGGGRSAVGWVSYEAYRVAKEVASLEIGSRMTAVLPHGYCMVAWKSHRQDGPTPRPLIKALGSSGEVLTEIGPGQFLDTATLASTHLDEPD